MHPPISRPAGRPRGLLLTLLVLLALAAAACADDDFAGAPADRGAAAATAAGVAEPADEQAAPADEPAEPDQAAEPEDPSEPEEPEAIVADLPGDPERGQELFFANGCNICHGDTGGGGIGPTIAMTRLTLDQVIGQYRNPRDAMPAFPADRVSDADVADIYSWLQTLPLPDEIVAGEGTP